MPPIFQFKPDHRRPSNRLTRFQDWVHHVTIRRRIRNVIGVAARRSGKTVGSRLIVWETGLDKRPGDIGYMAPTRSQAKRLLWRPLMQDMHDPAAKRLVRDIDKSDLAIEFCTGTWLRLFSAEAYERVRGDGNKCFIADEADDPKYTQEVFDEAIHPSLSVDEGQLVQIGTPKGKGRLYGEYKKGDPKNPEKDPDYISCQVTALEAGIIPREEVERARRLRPPRAFRQEYEASFETAGIYIFDEFKHSEHVIRRSRLPRRFDEVFVTVDWGEAKRGNMTVHGVVYPRKDEDGDDIDDLPTVYTIEEHSHERMPYTSDGWWKIARNIQDRLAPSEWICDPAQTIETYRDKLRFVLEKWAREIDGRRQTPKVIAANNEVRSGISTVQEFLHYSGYSGDLVKSAFYEPPHWFVVEDGPHPCDNLIRTMPKYAWKRLRNASEDAEPEEIPVKSDDHEIDSLRYGLHTKFGHIRGHSSRRTERGGGW
jgi:hypothetical protein